MLSRTAGALFWMSRYLERCEAVARLLDVNHGLHLDLTMGEENAWRTVVETTGDLDRFLKRHPDFDGAQAIVFLAFDPANPNSVLSCAGLARENARSVREYLPAEAWETVNDLYLRLREAAREPQGSGLDSVLEGVLSLIRQCDGILAATLTRDEGWQFCRLGRHLERADQTSRLVDTQHALLDGGDRESGPGARWEDVLKGAGALTMYRRRHGATQGERAAEFLLLDGAFPRSVAYCLRSAEESLRAINGTPPGVFSNAAEKALGKLAAELRYTEIGDILAEGIHLWLDHFQERLNAVGESVRREYFEGDRAPARDPGREEAASGGAQQ